MDIIALLNTLAKGLIKAGQDFFDRPDEFAELEGAVMSLFHKAAADYLAMTLNQMDEMLCESSLRQRRFTIVRHDRRTLVTTAGEVCFQHTLFKRRKNGKHEYLLDEMLHIPSKERFSTQAEAKILTEAAEHSYQQAADSLKIGGQEISKSAVMDKIRRIGKEIPEQKEAPEAKRKCRYLYIEADEDHIHSQKDRNGANGWIGKLVYLFEGKEKICEGKNRLIQPHYAGGLYPKRKGNKELWKGIQNYIGRNYDEDSLEKVYISGDGGNWIRAGVNYVESSLLVADKFHLMKYINRVADCVKEDREKVRRELYSSIYADKRSRAMQILELVENSVEGSEEAVGKCRQYLRNNWKAIQNAFADPQVIGCSAEGHVSHIFSDRMSSRPMGWSKEGADSMCRLRCYLKNEGSNVLDLVKYRRKKEWEKQKEKEAQAEKMVEKAAVKKIYSKAQRQAFCYVERLQASVEGDTVKKMLTIREKIYYI